MINMPVLERREASHTNWVILCIYCAIWRKTENQLLSVPISSNVLSIAGYLQQRPTVKDKLQAASANSEQEHLWHYNTKGHFTFTLHIDVWQLHQLDWQNRFCGLVEVFWGFFLFSLFKLIGFLVATVTNSFPCKFPLYFRSTLKIT